MASLPKTFLTPEEYLEQERRAEFKSEYFQGETSAMAGGSERHGLIQGNVFAALHQQFRGRPRRVYASDLRLKTPPPPLFTYPDVMVICGQPQFGDDRTDTVVNPVLIVEVLSPSTRDYDRGLKFEVYRKLPSLREYVTVAQDKPHIEHWCRSENGRWQLLEVEDLEGVIKFDSVGCVLPLTEIYDKVDWQG